MEHFNTLMQLIDKVSPLIPEGDYIQMCDTLKSLKESSMYRPLPLRHEPTVVSTYVSQPPPYEPIDIRRFVPEYDPMDWEPST